jgi:hypothetical protein
VKQHLTVTDPQKLILGRINQRWSGKSQQLVCPHCGHTDTYQRTDLIFKA